MPDTDRNEQINKILSVIKDKGCVTVTDIKRSMSEYNKAGGSDRLQEILTDMVSQKVLSVYTYQAGNGKSVDIYIYTDSSSNGNSSKARCSLLWTAPV